MMSLIEKVIEFVAEKLGIEINEENQNLYLMNFILILKIKYIGTLQIIVYMKA